MATHWTAVGALILSFYVVMVFSGYYPVKEETPMRPGRCPSHLLGFPSSFDCECDENCPDNHKCCPFHCGKVCVPPAIVRLECPEPPETAGKCVQACNCDNQCDNSQKCCSNGCGHVCTTPLTVKPGLCRFVIHCRDLPACSEDGNCAGDQKCCKSPCGKVCRDPF